MRKALEFAALAKPGFESLLIGERGAETLELKNDKTGEQIVISLGTVVADVLPRLGLGFVSRGFKRDVTTNQTAGVLH